MKSFPFREHAVGMREAFCHPARAWSLRAAIAYLRHAALSWVAWFACSGGSRSASLASPPATFSAPSGSFLAPSLHLKHFGVQHLAILHEVDAVLAGGEAVFGGEGGVDLVVRAGFDIGESLVPFDSAQPYWQAFLIGLSNTLRVAIAGMLSLYP